VHEKGVFCGVRCSDRRRNGRDCSVSRVGGSCILELGDGKGILEMGCVGVFVRENFCLQLV
jgi:hypothetical protein